jgi:tRNA1Val (adenine37-N6)-methyltransferase
MPHFQFQQFAVHQEGVTHAVGTDGVILGAWADVEGARKGLDIGTGTGLLSLMLAQRNADVEMDAVEIHAASADIAAANFARSPWSKRLRVWCERIQDFSLEASGEYDIIVSNPPFFSELTIAPDATRRLARHTATLSPSDLLTAIRRLLAPDGRCVLILPWQEGLQLCELAVPMGLYWTRRCEVRSRAHFAPERLLIQLEKKPWHLQQTTLCIYAKERAYTNEFQKLTKDFYL